MRGSRTAVFVVFAALAAFYGLGRGYSPVEPVQGDGYYTWLWGRSLAYDGDLDLTNEYARCGDPWGLERWGRPGGPPANAWTFGPALIWAPFALVGRLAHPDSAGCHGEVPEVAMAGSVVAALLALWLAFVLARRHAGSGAALLATLGVGVASPLPYYTIYLPSYGHAAAALALALYVERWDATRGDGRLTRWLLLGVLLGLAMLMRPQLGIWALLPLLEWLGPAARALREHDPRRFGRLVLGGGLFVLGAVVVFAPQLALHRAMFGGLLEPAQGPHFMRWSEPGLAGVLFGTTGGLLFWTPFLYLSLIGLVLGVLRRDRRGLALPMVLAFAATVYVNAAAWDWWGSMGFSNRRFTALVAPFVLGAAWVLAGLLRWAERRPRRAMAAVLAVGVIGFGAWNAAAMLGVARGRIDSWREQPADLAWQGVFRELSGRVYEWVGNPLAWPASIPFALRYDVHPRHWDAMQGMAVLYANYHDLAPRIGEEVIDPSRPLHRQYLVEGLEVRRARGRRAAVTTGERARMLVPLFIGQVEGLEVTWLALGESPATVALAWNGRAVAQARVAGRRWGTLRIAVPDELTRAGVNELVWSVAGGPVAIRKMRVLPSEGLPAGRRFGQSRFNDRRTRGDRSSDGSRR